LISRVNTHCVRRRRRLWRWEVVTVRARRHLLCHDGPFRNRATTMDRSKVSKCDNDRVTICRATSASKLNMSCCGQIKPSQSTAVRPRHLHPVSASTTHPHPPHSTTQRPPSPHHPHQRRRIYPAPQIRFWIRRKTDCLRLMPD
jgi:hypothetical protein